MEESLRVLAIQKACPADELFVYQVRLQLLKQKGDFFRQQDETDCARTGTATAGDSGPRLMYIKILRVQLHELRSSFPLDLPHIGK